MVNSIILFVMFLMTVSIPIIAIVGELAKTTPNTVFHSVVRSIICIGSLLFLSQLLQIGYKVNLPHFLAISFIFAISVFELNLEMNQTSFDKIFQNEKDTHV